MGLSTKMVIPKTITVGYRTRGDTYTGKLGYVIYTDAKGVLRKEASWNSWRDAKLEPLTVENAPMSGFVLNKKAGGYKTGYDVRRTTVRVYDPRDFEFEISVPNLLYILQETSSIKGKGIEGEFVYAWDGTELVLLPTCSAEYLECVNFTKHQETKVTKDNMVEGCIYTMKDMTQVMYLGRHDYCEKVHRYSEKPDYRPIGPHHIFLDLKKIDGKDESYSDYYLIQSGFTKLAAKVSDDISPLYADAYDKFKTSRYCNKVVEVKLVKRDPTAEDLDKGVVLILKEGDKLWPVRINKRSNGWRNDYFYQITRGPEFKPSLKGGSCALPKIPYNYSYGDRGEQFDPRLTDKKEFFQAILVTTNGHDFDLTRYTY